MTQKKVKPSSVTSTIRKPEVQESESPKNVYEAINKVMREVGYVQKQESDQLRYSYASESAFIKAIRPHMVEAGLVIYPIAMTEIPTEPFTSKAGTVINVSMINVTYRFHHAPSETNFDVNVVGKGMDTGDKDSNKAMTVAFKYALRQTLMIETGDDPDATGNGDFERAETHVSFERPLSPDALKTAINKRADDLKAKGLIKIAEGKRGLMVGVINRIFAGPNADEDRHILLEALFGEPSSKNLKAYQVEAVLRWLDITKDSGGEYVPSQMSQTEAVMVVDSLLEKGGDNEKE